MNKKEGTIFFVGFMLGSIYTAAFILFLKVMGVL